MQGLQTCFPEAVCGSGEWSNWGWSGAWVLIAFFIPSFFNFQAPQSKKPLLKKGSVLGSYLLDDKPVKRLDGCLCCVCGVSLCLLEYPVSQPVSSSPTLVLAGFGSMGGCSLTVALAASWHQVVLAQCEAEDAVS